MIHGRMNQPRSLESTNISRGRNCRCLPERTWCIWSPGSCSLSRLGHWPPRSINQTPESMPISVAPTSATPPLPKDILAEADLLAVIPGQGEVSAAARAEWFVTDYFSSGGGPARRRRPPGRFPPAGGSGSASYVEWAATSRIESVGEWRPSNVTSRSWCPVIRRLRPTPGAGSRCDRGGCGGRDAVMERLWSVCQPDLPPRPGQIPARTSTGFDSERLRFESPGGVGSLRPGASSR